MLLGCGSAASSNDVVAGGVVAAAAAVVVVVADEVSYMTRTIEKETGLVIRTQTCITCTIQLALWGK